MQVRVSAEKASESWPSTNGLVAINSSGSNPVASQEPGQVVDIGVVSLLIRLKLLRPSDFARKCKIVRERGILLRKTMGIVDTVLNIIGTLLENCLEA